MEILSKILSSKTRSQLFSLFFGIEHKGYYLREIERNLNLSLATIRQELNKLYQLKLLNKKKDGNRIYYSANRSHFLFNEIHNLVIKSSGFVKIIREVLIELDIKIAFVYGSIAADNYNFQSDIDLFIIGNISARAMSERLIDATEQIGREINYFIIKEPDIIKRIKEKDHFVTSVLKTEKIFIIGDEIELRAMA